MATLFRLSQGVCGEVLVASPAALARRVVPRAAFAKLVDVLQAEEEIDRERTLALLARGGYGRAPVVEDPGTFAVRGGVIDVFVPLYRFPVRLELFGDLLESIRFFDPETQRTLRTVKEVYIHPVRETVPTSGARLRERILEAADHASHPSTKTRAVLEQVEAGEDFFGVESLAPAFHARMAPLTEYLDDPEAPWLVDEPDAVLEALDDELARGDEAYHQRIADHRLAFPPSDFFLDAAELRATLDRARTIEARALSLVPSSGESSAPRLGLESESNADIATELRHAMAEKHEELLRPLVRRLRDWRDEGTRVVLVSPNLQHGERLESLLRGYGITPQLARTPSTGDLLEPGNAGVIEIQLGPLAHGFRLPQDGLAVVTESEIFGEKAARRSAKPKKVSEAFGADEQSFKELEQGAFVVHQVHGVGVYKGLSKLPLRGVAVDFLHLEYDGGALYLPVWRLNEVARYVGAEGLKPKVDKLGGITWAKTRSKVSKEVQKLAEDLLQIYAQRKALAGHGFRLDAHADTTFHEFEATFPFEETVDQQKAIDDVLADMEEERPMDRLVCGDVGYGKTEVALRAAMKAVLGGRQVAILAPTTVLVEQHAVTFAERMKDYPVRVAALSRFKPRAEQVEVLKGLAAGKIDVVIGTHRLLSSDVRFKELGLLVIDEEQRFGVSHKERLKSLRTQIDVLTMTATPIPRTLHMALSGLREISIITTPPADRLAIRTLLARYDDNLLVEGVKRELARGGQVFFVHNRIEDIHKWSAKIRELLPEVRVASGHGQMASEALEQVMVDFVDGKYDVLVCTTIIESGLDIPRANTMFVDRADCFGLAQLYQLRGRIGRSKVRAYCYLIVPPESALTGEAKQRLAVLQRFTELGAGFQIASHDLEIRGAGDLLGAKQSGSIAAVGFEMYTQLLEEAVAALRGEAIARERDPELTCDLPGFIPDDYLPDPPQRLDFYKRMSTAQDEEEVAGLVNELTDRYGPPPDEVALLADIMVVKGLGRRLGATAIELSETRIALALADDTPLRPAQVLRLVNEKRSLWRLTPDMRLTRHFAEAEKPDRLKIARALLADLLRQAQSPAQ
jgi:transcription-repair coupling factor (superfamily II helicase)